MTDREHAAEIATAMLLLNRATELAWRDGLHVEFGLISDPMENNPPVVSLYKAHRVLAGPTAPFLIAIPRT